MSSLCMARWAAAPRSHGDGSGGQRVRAYWQPQLPEDPSPQHDALADGSQHVACLTGAQQLAAVRSTLSSSCFDADDSPDSAVTTVPTRILRFFAVPTFRAVQRRAPIARL